MNKSAIQKFAIQARQDLIEQVKQQAFNYGIDENGYGDKTSVFVNGVALTDEKVKQRTSLINEVESNGFEQTMEKVAYTWFNRFIALRFMEVNDYLPTHVRVFSDPTGAFKPEILKHALDIELIDDKGNNLVNKSKVIAYLDDAEGTDDLYRYLLLTQCKSLHHSLPKMFSDIGYNDYTELLLPLKILSEDSVIAHMVNDIEEDDFKEAVEIIGWLYQYYNTEPKADVFAGLKKNIKITKENIPAATQLFTPDWIVRYMVENSLGRIAVDKFGVDPAQMGWKYYLPEAEQTEEVQNQLKIINSGKLALEELKIIDPCMGSGHILVYVFDVLMQIYENQGYTSRDAVASIIENNLFGLDIDERAYQLAYFALMMKARANDRRFLTRKIAPQVYCPKGYEDGEEFGSLLNVEKLEEKPHMPEIITFDNMNYEQDLNTWNFRRLLHQKYDVVVTNPPYMGASGMSGKLSDFVKKNYPDSKSDMFACFIERGNVMTTKNGYNCMVTMQSWMFLSSFEKMREKIMNTKVISNLMHMENMVMGIAFGTAVAIIQNSNIKGYKGTYNHITMNDIGDNNKPITFPVMQNRFAQVSTENFSKIPGSPIAYWASEKMFKAFEKNEAISKIAPPKQGLATANNDDFLRLWFEVNIDKVKFNITSCDEANSSGGKWFPYNKGGVFRRWYGNREYVVNWENDGELIKNFKDENGKVRSRPQNTQYYFKSAITWSDITSAVFSGRYCESGFMFDVKGSSGFPSKENIYYILGFLNSTISQRCIKILNPTITTQVGDMARIPVVFSEGHKNTIDELVKENIFLAKEDWDSFETSWDFKVHPLIKGNSIKDAYLLWENDCNTRFKKLKANEEQINIIFIDLYGLQDELSPVVEDKNVTLHIADIGRDIKSLINFAVSCMFGRYSLNMSGIAYAGGEFDNAKYANFIPDKDNIIPISDDEYFEDDIVGRFIEFIKVVYSAETLEQNLMFIAEALGGKGTPREVIRNYFVKDFYKEHCNIYSVRGAGKRPIFWQFDSGEKNGFKALTYIHRYESNLLAKIRTDYVHEQQERYRTQIAQIEDLLVTATPAEKTKLNKKHKLLLEQSLEIKGYEEKIQHLADQNISIDLDDGVVKNYAIFSDVVSKIK